MADGESTTNEQPDARESSEDPKACPKCGCYGGNGWLPRIDDTRYSCPECAKGTSV